MAVVSLTGQLPRFAVFLPVRNGANYIAQAIDSILAQSLGDFALVILDNRSSDDTVAVARRYADPRITVIEGEADLGIYQSWRRVHDLLAAGEFTPEFVTIMGHDDILYPDFLQTISELIAARPDASLYQTHFDLIDGEGRVRRACRPMPAREYAKDFFLSRCWAMRDSFGTGLVFRASDYVRVGGIPDLPLLLWSDDLLVIALTSLSYKACAEPASFAYRLHYGSASGAVTVGKFVSLTKALSMYVAAIENRHAAFLRYANDRAAFGRFLDRQSAMLAIPWRRRVLGADTADTVDQLSRRAAALIDASGVPRDGGGLAVTALSLLKRLYTLFRLIKN